MDSIRYNYLKQVDITGAGKTVLSGLVSHCWTKNYCYPSVARLITITGLSRATIFRVLKALEDCDIITRVKRFSKKGQRSNLYIIKGLQFDNTPKDSGLNPSLVEPPKTLSERDKSYDSYSIDTGFLFSSFTPDILYGDLKFSTDPKLEQPKLEQPKLEQLKLEQLKLEQPKPEQPKLEQPKPEQPKPEQPKTPVVKFEGVLDLYKIVEIFDLYCKHNFLNRCTSDLIDLLACCSFINRELGNDVKRAKHKKKIKNPYGLITFLTKNKKLTDPIKQIDDDKARSAIPKLRRMGLVDF